MNVASWRCFEPVELRGVRLRNRFVAAPMASGTGDEESGAPGDRSREFYAPLAASGVGLVVLEHAAVRADGKVRRGQFMMDQDDLVEPYRAFLKPFKEAGVPVVAQLNHAGSAIKDPRLLTPGFEAVSASPVRHPRDEVGLTPRYLKEKEIFQIEEHFAAAARRALAAGFAGVELHACHGFLLGQFLSPVTNRRSDSYGGGIDGRSLLLRDLVDILRGVVKDAILAVRLGVSDALPGEKSPGLDVEEAVWVARQIALQGVDVVDVSGNLCGYDGPGEAWWAPFARRIREVCGGRPQVICSGGIRSAKVAEELLEGRVCDLVGLGRPLRQNPGLVRGWEGELSPETLGR